MDPSPPSVPLTWSRLGVIVCNVNAVEIYGCSTELDGTVATVRRHDSAWSYLTSLPEFDLQATILANPDEAGNVVVLSDGVELVYTPMHPAVPFGWWRINLSTLSDHEAHARRACRHRATR